MALVEANTDQITLNILDEIGIFGISAKNVVDAMGIALKNYPKAEVSVLINSPGGSVFDGISIYNYLRSLNNTVETRVIGIAASAASIIAMAGDTIAMSKYSMMMIHNSWSLAIGDGDSLREQAEIQDKVDNIIADIYVGQTNLPLEQIKEKMKNETWLTADEAKDEFFIDVIYDDTDEDDVVNAISIHADKFKSLAGYSKKPADKAKITEATTLKELEAAIVDNSDLTRKDAMSILSKVKSINAEIKATHDVEAIVERLTTINDRLKVNPPRITGDNHV